MDPKLSGLDAQVALARLAAEGPNALPDTRSHGLAALLGSVVREPMFLLLIGAAAVYLVLGDAIEAMVLAASVVVIITITVVQERRTERALDALRDLSAPRALVIRSGREVRIAGFEVVRGDLLVLREGDRVAADARLLESRGLMVDESLLTGESVPVAKDAGAAGPEGGVMSATLIVRGAGLGEVTATGPRSELGRIGAMLGDRGPRRTPLELETARMVRVFAAGGALMCIAAAVLFAVVRGDTLGGILAGLTLAMAMLPEEFPVVLTVFLALGAMRIARQGVLTRRLPAVELLGATTMLCCDKTGTLTENRMRVVETWRAAWSQPTPEDSILLATAALACEASPFDPMERALLDASPDAFGSAGALERHYPLAEGFLAVCHAWRVPGAPAVAAMKGAPETVIALCGLPEAEARRALDAAAAGAARGLRVLAIARAQWDQAAWPEDPAALPFRFLGLVALADPVRENVPAAIALCRRAGIAVAMITGDHPATASAIAAQCGIDSHRVVTGTELEALDDAALAGAVKGCRVFARVRPEQKLRLVTALRASGEVVAMTGDGVNDAPALRAAHIGVAMGRRGTDVAREAADLVLLDDDFTALVATVRMGRRIYDNIRDAMRFLVAVHVPLAGMALLPLGVGWPLLLMPMHVVFLEFVIDPSCSIVFEAERSDEHVMDRPPRPPGERLFTARLLLLGLALGAGVFAAVAAVYGFLLAHGAAEGEARAAGFATLVFGDLALVLANRSPSHTSWELLRRPNRALWWIAGAATAALLLAIHVPALARLFRFEPIGIGTLAAALAAALASVAWYDLYKVDARQGRRRARG